MAVVTGLTNQDASIVLGMIARGDKDNDIAAWFGVIQARVTEVKKGAHGPAVRAVDDNLPPRGAPGPKGRRARYSVEKALGILRKGGADSVAEAIAVLEGAIAKFDNGA
ncbi:hypothetical protein [Labrys monachus]|uniref:Uncharacterized protein n=1 Tax=Labrys monachus TaxID=217067 RepID=A0ABU0FDI3_9HYPH|nr:hypothetical protein [Labrys monachus]MDQ0392667.1 hypothetical protein [Labrys monachus]